MENHFAKAAESQTPQSSASDGINQSNPSHTPRYPALSNKEASSLSHEHSILLLPAEDPVSSKNLSPIEVVSGHGPQSTEPKQSVSEPPSNHTGGLNKRRLLVQISSWRRFARLQVLLTDTWWPEVLAIAFSSCCITTISGLLLKYDDHEIPDFRSGLTLNAIISVLAVGSRSTLIFAVAATISQSKWSWFHTRSEGDKRRLRDLQIFDDASRGPLGSLAMLLKRSILSLSSIGAIIIILTLVYDPFVQQGVSYPVRSVNVSSEAILRQAIAVPYLANIPAPATSAVYAGLYADRTSFQRTPYCPTGKCTWAPFQTIEWCSKCRDVSEQLFSPDCEFTVADIVDYLREAQPFQRNCTISIGTGRSMLSQLSVTNVSYNINRTSQAPRLTLNWSPVTLLYGGTDPNGSGVSDSNVSYLQGTHKILGEINPLVALLFVTFGDTRRGPPVSLSDTLARLLHGTVCVLTPCLRSYQISVTSGELASQVLEEDYGVLKVTEEGGICWKPEPLRDQNVSMIGYGIPKEPREVFIQSNSSNMAWCNFEGGSDWPAQIYTPLSGSTSNTFFIFPVDDPEEPYCLCSAGIPYGASDNPVLDTLLGNGLPTPASDIIAGISDALTYANLHPGSSVYSEYPPDTVNVIHGTVWAQKVFVHVRWAWLSLPIFLTLAAIAFLAITAYSTRRQHLPLWKASPLALLYHGLEDRQVDSGRHYELASEMVDNSRSVYVRLATGDDGGERMRLRA